MSVLPEYFDPTTYIQPDFDSHFAIKRPYTTFAKSMNLKFSEYNVRKPFSLILLIKNLL